jgi:Phage integrase, N-terminal SAM-like domain
MAADPLELRVQSAASGYTLVGPEQAIEAVNEFLRYLVDRNYSRRTVRAYAFDLLHFLRWLSVDARARAHPRNPRRGLARMLLARVKFTLISKASRWCRCSAPSPAAAAQRCSPPGGTRVGSRIGGA